MFMQQWRCKKNYIASRHNLKEKAKNKSAGEGVIPTKLNLVMTCILLNISNERK
jgi:hypothetical protein